MSHITPDTLEQLRKMLLDQKEKLLAVRKGVDEVNPVHDQDRLDDNANPGDDAAEENSMISSEVFENQIDVSVQRIDAALQRIEEGTYGHDEETGEEIPVERLLVDPTATHVVTK